MGLFYSDVRHIYNEQRFIHAIPKYYARKIFSQLTRYLVFSRELRVRGKA